MRKGLLVVVPLVLIACGKKDAPPAEGKPTAKSTEPAEPPGPPTSPAPGWDGAPLVARLAGAWVLAGAPVGTPQALEVTGDRGKVWDGERELAVGVSAPAPCLLKLEETALDGSKASTMIAVAFDGDTLRVGLGMVAVAHGKGWVVCGGDGVYTLRGDECLSWQPNLASGAWKPSTAKCALVGDTLTVTGRAGVSTLTRLGAVFATEQFASSQAARHKDLASARAAASAPR